MSISLIDNLKKKRMIAGTAFGSIILAAGVILGVDEEVILRLEGGLASVVIGGEVIVDCFRAISDALKVKWSK